MTHFVTSTVQDFGYVAVFLLMLAESACIPIPSEATMLFGGALANATFTATLPGHPHHLNFILVGLLGTVGNLVGSWIAYAAGKAGGRPLVERWGRLVLLKPHDIDRAEAWFAKHGERAVFVSRLLPVIRTFISLPAGVAEMPLGTFTIYTVAGCLPWTFALAGVGYAVGGSWTRIQRYIALAGIALAIILVGLIGLWMFRRYRARRREAEHSTAP